MFIVGIKFQSKENTIEFVSFAIMAKTRKESKLIAFQKMNDYIVRRGFYSNFKNYNSVEAVYVDTDYLRKVGSMIVM